MGRAAALASGCALFLLVPGALLWLGLRGRLDALGTHAIGSHGPWASLGLGLAVGLALTGVLAALSRYLKPYSRIEKRLVRMFGTLEDQWILFLSITTALAEELFFRLAALDALGLWGAAAMYAVFSTGRGLWLWTVFAALTSLLFGWMVESGFGLLSVTTAHAIASYLTLRRMLLP